MIEWQPGPPLMDEALLAVAPGAGGLEAARQLNYEEFLHALELADHLQAVEQLSEQLSGLLSNPPFDGDDEKSKQARSEHGIECIRVQCALIREDRCWTLPLDHEYGEQLDPPEDEHWLDAPGVNFG
jgi:hypothetical protein